MFDKKIIFEKWSYSNDVGKEIYVSKLNFVPKNMFIYSYFSK
jgi:hypothetical protein